VVGSNISRNLATTNFVRTVGRCLKRCCHLPSFVYIQITDHQNVCM
jgi:hypothetical protein